MSIYYLIQKVYHWFTKIGYSVADQALMSGANFLLNVLLAKWIAPDEYGLFAIIFSLFLFLSGFHNALLIEPLVVIGPIRYYTQLPNYLTIVVVVHFVFALGSIIVSLLIFPIIVTWWQKEVSLWVLLALNAAVFFVLLFWLLRRAAYLNGRAALATLGSFAYLIALVIITLLLYKQDWITVVTAYWIMSVASLFGTVIYWQKLGINLRYVKESINRLTVKNIFIEHWHYGKWIIAGTLAYSFSTLIYIPLVGILVGLAESGVIKAMQNLIQPVLQVAAALSIFFVPWLSSQRNIYGSNYPLLVLPKILLVFLGTALAFFLPIVMFNQDIVHFIYRNNYYVEYSWLLYYFGFAAIIQVVVYAIATVARSIEYSNAIFLEELAGACFVLTFGVILVWKWKLIGVAISLLGGAISQLIVMIWLVRRRLITQ